MKTFLKIGAVAVFAAIAAAAFSGCGKTEKVQIRLSTNQIDTHPDTLALKAFADHVNSKMGDKFEAVVYPNATLGANEKVLELIRQGSVQLLVLSTANIETFDPLYSLFSIPYLFTSQEKYEEFISDPKMLDKLNVNANENGFITMAAFTAGTRNFYTREPVYSVADLAGKKIRVQASPTNVAMMEAFGAAATPMAYGDVYSALQQSVIDGAENSELALTDMKHGEVCKYFSYDMHQMSPDMLVVSYKFMETLNDEEKKVIAEASKIATELEFKLWHEHTAEAIEIAKRDLGVTFIDVNVKEFQDKVLPLHQEMLDKYPQIKELYDAAREADSK